VTIGDAPLRERARAVLERNHRGTYTVPAEGLYPYQWCWDSGPIALGWAAAGAWERAWTELDSLLSAQWATGFVPHIVFWSGTDDYFPGPDVWGTGDEHPPTTGITQPPLPISCAARLFAADPDRARARARLSHLWPRFVAWFEWLAWARRGPHGACVIVHPWESGMDNAPCWDVPLREVPTAGHPDLARRDVATVSAAHRPTDFDYRHYLGIVAALRRAGWDTERQVLVSPFAVEDVAFTAIAARAAADLAAVTAEIDEDPAWLQQFADDARAAIELLWDEDAGWYRCFDVKAGAQLEPLTVTGLAAVWSGGTDGARLGRMLERVDSWQVRSPYSVLTCDPDADQFERARYWRGPVWVLVNWLIADGLAGAGESARAEALRVETLGLVAEHGFSEYYDALTGAGIGGRSFSWSAALTLAWLTSDR
jgi:hypothetical protein